jgi:hypothetical protein
VVIGHESDFIGCLGARFDLAQGAVVNGGAEHGDVVDELHDVFMIAQVLGLRIMRNSKGKTREQ